MIFIDFSFLKFILDTRRLTGEEIQSKTKTVVAGEKKFNSLGDEWETLFQIFPALRDETQLAPLHHSQLRNSKIGLNLQLSSNQQFEKISLLQYDY